MTAARARPIRILCGALALVDLALGLGALVFPGLYLALMHPLFGGGPTYWLARTGAIWLGFAAVELWAAAAGGPIELVAALRLLDVPADVVYLATATDLGGFGRFALVFSPAFNLVTGLGLLVAARRRR